MYLSYGNLGLFCLGIAVVWFWHDSLRARAAATVASMAACERIGLQFLDGTAAFSSLRFARVDGRLRLRRTYVFDYTSQSIERRQGFAIMVGTEVEYVGFAPEHRAQPISAAEPFESKQPTVPRSAEIIDMPSETPNNVFDLNEHRARRGAIEEKPDSSANGGDRLH
jgi:Protein of unknown function (DUF3301)